MPENFDRLRDYGKADNVEVGDASFYWNDIGSWSSLRSVLPLDDDGNALRGNVVTLDSANNVLICGDDDLLGVIGMRDIAVVKSGNGILVCPLSEEQRVKELVGVLKKIGRITCDGAASTFLRRPFLQRRTGNDRDSGMGKTPAVSHPADVLHLPGADRGDSRGTRPQHCEQFLLALHGSLRVVTDDGERRETFELDSPLRGLHLPAGLWGIQQDHTPDNVLLVLASEPYDADDYIRDYSQYLEYVKTLK